MSLAIDVINILGKPDDLRRPKLSRHGLQLLYFSINITGQGGVKEDETKKSTCFTFFSNKDGVQVHAIA
jgi:hypothetical protein